MLDELDPIDRKLLELLQRDGRMSNADLARTVRMAPSAVFERVRRLERDGVIRGYGAHLDARALERPLLAFVLVRTDERTGENTAGAELAAVPEVLEVHHVAGQDSYLVKVRVKDPEALGRTAARALRRHRRRAIHDEHDRTRDPQGELGAAHRAAAPARPGAPCVPDRPHGARVLELLAFASIWFVWGEHVPR
jgi:Lrp/AsnC family leucine-responsive transcriptional regulator